MRVQATKQENNYAKNLTDCYIYASSYLVQLRPEGSFPQRDF